MTVRVGISGWTYPPWRGEFYPKGLPHRLELEHVAGRMDTVEINGSFYSLQRASSYRSWAQRTPEDFVFSVKGGRFITHMKKLRDVEGAVATFLASGVLALGPKLGPLLWQLPPNLGYDPGRMADFFALLPSTTTAAAALAADADGKLKKDPWTSVDADRPLRHAVEVRHDTFIDDRFFAQCSEHDVALVVADTAGRWPQIERRTASFSYLRLHGADELYVSGYTDAGLDEWARKVRGWARGGHDVFVYFDNDVKVRSPHDAMRMADRVSTAAQLSQRR